jgi:hypothetical protein
MVSEAVPSDTGGTILTGELPSALIGCTGGGVAMVALSPVGADGAGLVAFSGRTLGAMRDGAWAGTERSVGGASFAGPLPVMSSGWTEGAAFATERSTPGSTGAFGAAAGGASERGRSTDGAS